MIITKYFSISSKNFVRKDSETLGKQYTVKLGRLSLKIEREFSEKEAVEVLMSESLDFEEVE